MKQTVFRLNGQVINIGPWDFKLEPIMAEDRGQPIFDQVTGELLGYVEVKIGDRITNPIPDGAVESQEDVTVRADGGAAVSTDYASLRRAEYPSLADQLDALWKGGADTDNMRQKVLSVKAKYPK